MRDRSQGAAGMSAGAPGWINAIDQIALEGNMFSKQAGTRSSSRGQRVRRTGFVSRTTVAALVAATAIFAGVGADSIGSRALGVTNPPPVTKAHNEFSDYFQNISPGYFPSLVLTNQNYNAVNA